MPKKKKINISIKTQLLVATGVVLLLVGFGFFVGWLDSSTDMKLTGNTKATSFNDVTVKGKPACVGKTGDGPQTMECLMTLKTASGAVYAIKGGVVHGNDENLEFTGTLASPSKDEVYNIDGVLTVK
jgi:hypothetical protein